MGTIAAWWTRNRVTTTARAAASAALGGILTPLATGYGALALAVVTEVSLLGPDGPVELGMRAGWCAGPALGVFVAGYRDTTRVACTKAAITLAAWTPMVLTYRWVDREQVWELPPKFFVAVSMLASAVVAAVADRVGSRDSVGGGRLTETTELVC